jgi:hypothetical protein
MIDLLFCTGSSCGKLVQVRRVQAQQRVAPSKLSRLLLLLLLCSAGQPVAVVAAPLAGQPHAQQYESLVEVCRALRLCTPATIMLMLFALFDWRCSGPIAVHWPC